jgi:hypothetical protein
MDETAGAYDEVAALGKILADRKKTLESASPSKEATDALAELEKQLSTLESGSEEARGFGVLNRDIARYLTMIDSADLRPTQSARAAASAACQAYKKDVGLWNKVNAESVPALNKYLEQYKLLPLSVAAKSKSEPVCGE